MSFQLKAELLTEISVQQAGNLIKNPNFGAQEKRNGKRRIVVRSGNSIFCFNREGEKRELPRPAAMVFLSHPLTQFVVDIELEGSVRAPRVYIFDALILGKEELAQEKYEYRERRAHEDFDNFHPMINVLRTMRTQEAKLTLTEQLYKDNAEGVVFKNMNAPYKQGRAGQHFKLKFWKRCDCVVMGPSPEGHDSVEIGVYWNGKLHRVSGVSLIGKVSVKAGDVVEVKYLYATKTRHIVQPGLIGKRDDKKATDCTVDQLVINRDMLSTEV